LTAVIPPRGTVTELGVTELDSVTPGSVLVTCTNGIFRVAVYTTPTLGISTGVTAWYLGQEIVELEDVLHDELIDDVRELIHAIGDGTLYAIDGSAHSSVTGHRVLDRWHVHRCPGRGPNR